MKYPFRETETGGNTLVLIEQQTLEPMCHTKVVAAAMGPVRERMIGAWSVVIVLRKVLPKLRSSTPQPVVY